MAMYLYNCNWGSNGLLTSTQMTALPKYTYFTANEQSIQNMTGSVQFIFLDLDRFGYVFVNFFKRLVLCKL